MKKNFIALITFCCISLSACLHASSKTSGKALVAEETPVVMAQEANEEYDTIAEFLVSSDKPAFLLQSQRARQTTATPSEADIEIQIANENVSVGEHYVAVNYECTVGEETFLLQLGTYNFPDGEGSMQQILDRGPGLFSEKEIGGQQVYYCPGSEYEPYNYYLMVLNGNMFLLNIEQGYDKYVEMIMNHLDSR